MNSKTTHDNLNFISQFLIKIIKRHYIIGLTLMLSFNSFAQTTWTGASNTDWFDASNWSDGVPDANDDVTIDPGGSNPSISTTGAIANSVRINDGATLFLTATGRLDIDLIDNGSVQDGLLVLGTLDNSGTVTVGATTSGGNYGIYLGIVSGSDDPGTIQNRAGALLQVDNCMTFGIYFSSANGSIFNNNGTIDIGTNGNIGNSALVIDANSFRNNETGILNIGTAFDNGIWIDNNATFANVTNLGTININDSSTNLDIGVRVSNGGFSNRPTGILNIDNTEINAIFIENAQTMTNDNSVNLGQNATIGNVGILVAGSFQNSTSGGTLNIDRTIISAIEVTTTGQFDHWEPSVINIGNIASVGNIGINNSGDFNNGGGWTGLSSLSINNFSQTGISNVNGDFSSQGSIVIGNSSGGLTGIENNGASASFTNFIATNTGTLEINNVNTGLSCPSGLFSNRSQLTAGNITSLPTLIDGTATIDTFRNQIDGSGVLTANGEISATSFTNNGGLLDPDSQDFGVSGFGVMSFNDDEDFNQATLKIDISDDADEGIIYDIIEVQGTATLTGGDLEINIDFPTGVTDGELITFFSSDALVGEFTLSMALPMGWNLLYNFPNDGDISVEFGEINSISGGDFSDPSIWAGGVVPDPNTPAIINGGHTVTIDVPMIDVGRVEITETATLIIPTSTEVLVSGSLGTSVVNNGTLDIDGTLNIESSGASGINNNGIITLNGMVGSSALIDITNTSDTAINNVGDITIGDNAAVNIDDANIGIENTNNIIINEEGLLEIDFTLETAIVTNQGSTMTNNGDTFIGIDASATNFIGLYGIDHSGYLLNAGTGLIVISGATESQILLPFIDNTLLLKDISDGSVDNFGEMNLNGNQTNAVEQGDSPTTVKSKHKHKLRKRPTPNPGRDFLRNNGESSYINQEFSLLRGNGIIESDIAFLDGGVISPGLLDGDEGIIIFDGDEDFQNVTLKIDINGKTLKGTDYDLIALIGTTTLGGNLDVDITYTPTIGDIITFIESDNVIATFINPILPPNWDIKYNYPNQGDVSVEYGEALSVDENRLDDIIIYSHLETDNILISGVLVSETTMQLFDITGRLILSRNLDTATTINSIDVTSFASGTYIVKLSSEFQKSKTQKIIID